MSAFCLHSVQWLFANEYTLTSTHSSQRSVSLYLFHILFFYCERAHLICDFVSHCTTKLYVLCSRGSRNSAPISSPFSILYVPIISVLLKRRLWKLQTREKAGKFISFSSSFREIVTVIRNWVLHFLQISLSFAVLHWQSESAA